MVNSEILLVRAVHALEQAGLMESDWSVGGGTVLCQYFNHRISKDIDIFLENVQNLGALSPRINEAFESALDYDEMANYLSLTFSEGKIDFIAASSITGYSSSKQLFFGQEVFLDHPVEIVVKKIYFRGDRVLPRDLFDLAVVYESGYRNSLVEALRKMQDKVFLFEEAFRELSQRAGYKLYSEEFAESILLGGKGLILKEADICRELLHEVKK